MWPGLVLLLGACQLLVKLAWVLGPVRWEVGPHGLVLVSRQLTRVVRQHIPRSAIGTIAVEKVRLPNHSMRTLHVVVAGPEGYKLAVASGSRRELDALCGVLRDALGLPPDPAGEATYPPRPAGVRSRRQVTRAGVWLTHRPPYVPWGVVAVALPLLLGAALLLEHVLDFRSPTRPWTQTEARVWAAVRVACLTLIPLALLCVAVYRLRRSTTLGVKSQALVLAETGLVRPCQVEWPLSDVRSVEVAEAGPPRASRAAVAIVLGNGQTVRSLDGAARREVEWIVATLRHALGRSASASA